MDKDPDDSFTLYGIALEYISKKDYKKAEEYFSILMKKNPQYVPAYMQMGRLKENMNDFDSAKDFYKRGIIVAKETGDKHATKEMEDFLDDLE